MTAFSTLSRRAKWLLGLTALVLLAAPGAGVYYWLRSPPSVPEIPLDSVEIELTEAINKARAAVVKAPRSANAWGHLGLVLLANQVSLDIALACFKEAERLDPEEPRWPYLSAGLLAGDLGKPEEAAPKLERAVALADRAGNAPSAPRLLLAETLASLGQVELADRHFKEVLANEPNNPRAHFGLGLLAYSRRDWKECRTHLEACLGSPEARKKASAHLATVCARLGDKEASDRYAKISDQGPALSPPWTDPYSMERAHLMVRKMDRYQMAEHLEAQGRFDSAVNILRLILEKYPDDPFVHLMMGRYLGQIKGQLPQAEEHLNKARQLGSDSLQLNYVRSLVLLNKGEAVLASNGDPLKAKAIFEESAKSARQALAMKSDYGYAYLSLGLALRHLGQERESLAALRQAVHCNPEQANNQYFLGKALADNGDIAAARYHLEQAVLLAHPNVTLYKAALDKLPKKDAPKSK